MNGKQAKMLRKLAREQSLGSEMTISISATKRIQTGVDTNGLPIMRTVNSYINKYSLASYRSLYKKIKTLFNQTPRNLR